VGGRAMRAPLRRYEMRSVVLSGVTDAQAASREVLRLKSVDMRQARGGIGFSTPASSSPFLTGPAVRTRRHPPLPSRKRVHPLRAFSLYRVPSAPYLPRRSFEPRAPSMGLPSLIATSVLGVVATGFHARHLPSSAFLTPSTALSATDLVGLFHPTATSRVLPFRGFPSRTAAPSRRWPLPSRRLAALPCC